MANWIVENRITGEVAYAYTADEPVEWSGMEFATHNQAIGVDTVNELRR